MNYPLLKEGDVLPTVSILQVLLNCHNSRPILKIDGILGRKTLEAIAYFCKVNIQNYFWKNYVDSFIWEKLSNGINLPILDCIDVFDNALYEMEVKDIMGVGATPIQIGGMCNGISAAVGQILRNVPRNGLFLLRFHGHGAPGLAAISSGKGDIGNVNEDLSDITNQNFKLVKQILADLKPIFLPYGSVQFMHCNTAERREGRALLNKLADIWQVPVSASTDTQLGGGKHTFKFEGNTYTAIPGNQSLKKWSSGIVLNFSQKKFNGSLNGIPLQFNNQPTLSTSSVRR